MLKAVRKQEFHISKEQTRAFFCQEMVGQILATDSSRREI